jgi:hypothetical protein
VWDVQIRHLERVKSYAPHVRHVVLDVECRPKQGPALSGRGSERNGGVGSSARTRNDAPEKAARTCSSAIAMGGLINSTNSPSEATRSSEPEHDRAASGSQADEAAALGSGVCAPGRAAGRPGPGQGLAACNGHWKRPATEASCCTEAAGACQASNAVLIQQGSLSDTVPLDVAAQCSHGVAASEGLASDPTKERLQEAASTNGIAPDLAAGRPNGTALPRGNTLDLARDALEEAALTSGTAPDLAIEHLHGATAEQFQRHISLAKRPVILKGLDLGPAVSRCAQP